MRGKVESLREREEFESFRPLPDINTRTRSLFVTTPF